MVPCDDRRMKRKQQFLKAVQILAPDDRFIHQAARRVQEEMLPLAPGGAALEFVVAMQNWQQVNCQWVEHSARRYSHPRHDGCENSSKEMENWREMCCHQRVKKRQNKIPLKDVLRIKSAEYWLKLGEWREALLELQQLPENTKKQPSVIKMLVSATGAAMKQNGYPAAR